MDWDCHSVKGLDGVEFVKCVQESFLRQHVEDPTRERAKLDLLLGNRAGQVTEVTVGTTLGPATIVLLTLK